MFYGNFKNVSVWICGNDVLRNIRFSSKSNTFLKDKISVKYKMFSNKTCFGFYTMKVCYLNLETCVCGSGVLRNIRFDPNKY